NVEHSLPFFWRNVEEILDLPDASVVDHNVDRAETMLSFGYHRINFGFFRDITPDSDRFRTFPGSIDFCCYRLSTPLANIRNDHFCSFLSKQPRRRLTKA